MPPIEIIARGLCLQKNHLLLCKPVRENYYYLPGGHVEFEEPLQRALQREWQEELGFTCDVGNFIQFFESIFAVDSHKHHEYSFLFKVTCKNLSFPEPPLSMESKLTFHWAPLDQLPHLNVLPKVMIQTIIEMNF